MKVKDDNGKPAGKSPPGSEEKKKKHDKAPTRKKLKKVRSSPVISPLFCDGICQRCKSTNYSKESITCSVCDASFHTACRGESGSQLNDSICSRTFRDSFTSLANSSERWGNLMFVCEECISMIDMVKSGKLLQPTVGKPKHPKSFEVASSQTDDLAPLKPIVDTDKPNDMLNEVKSLILESNKSVLEHFKNEMLRCVNEIVEEKLTLCSAPVENPVNLQTIQRPVSAASSYEDENEYNTSDNIPTTISYANALNNGSCPSMSASINVSPMATRENSTMRTKEKLVLDSPTCQEGLSDAPKIISEALFNIPVLALNDKNLTTDQKITLVFPSKSDRDKAKTILESNPAMQNFGFMMNMQAKALPKITVSNIPLQCFDNVDAADPGSTEYRTQGKAALMELILLKNETLKSFIDKGHIFEIVYLNIGQKYATAGIKVSPQIRNFLTKTGSNYIFIENCACPVKDRFIVLQCFNCQKLGHMSTQCPEKSSVVCMYCSGKHTTSSCQFKQDRQKHRCRNCSLSKDPRTSAMCSTHHSGSQDCPIIQIAIKRYRENTQSASKN